MTILHLFREPRQDDHTPGVLFVNGRYFSFTLEDIEREIAGQPVASWKVKGETAIPLGTYGLHVATSPRLGRPVPWLIDVPGFTAIQIHPLNVAAESEGCIGLGYTRTLKGIGQSRGACDALTAVLVSNGGTGRITIESPFRLRS